MKRYIPITEVMDRYTVYRKPIDIYPLYQTYKSIYNFQNIAESVNKWVSYSKSEKKNFDKLLELFNIVDRNDCKENIEIIGKNIKQIALTLESPSAYRPSLLTAIKETEDETKKNLLINIYNALSEAVQCDRMIKNHSIISKTFNIDKCVREAVYEDSIPEVIYELCSFIDTYQMGIDSKYSLALEEVLLSFKKNHIAIDEDTIISNVTDYFLSNYVHENDSPKELLTILSETLDKNRFFNSNSYVNTMISECGKTIVEIPQEKIMNYIEPDRTPIEEGLFGSIFGKDKQSKSSSGFKVYFYSTSKETPKNSYFYKTKQSALNHFIGGIIDKESGIREDANIIKIHSEILSKLKNSTIYQFFANSSDCSTPDSTPLPRADAHIECTAMKFLDAINNAGLKIDEINDSKIKPIFLKAISVLHNVFKKYDKIFNKAVKIESASSKKYLARPVVIMNYDFTQSNLSEEDYEKYTEDIMLSFKKECNKELKKYGCFLEIYNWDDSGIGYLYSNDSTIESVTYNEALMEGSFKDTLKIAIDKFKMLPAKTESAFKALIQRLIVFNSDQDIIDGTTNVFSLLFYFVIVVGAFSIGVIPGILGALCAATIGFKAERSYFPKVLKTWYKQRDSLSRKIDKCTDPEKKKKLEVMLKEIDKNIQKLEEYFDSIKGSDEPTSYESRPKNYSNKDNDDFGFDFGFDEEERNTLVDIAVMCEGINSIKWDRTKMESTIFAESTVERLDNRDLEYLTEFITRYPDSLDKDKWRECLLNESTRVSKNPGYAKYVRMDICNECIKEINSANNTPYTEDIFAYLNNLYEYTSNITQSMYSINEMGIGSTIAMAGHKLMNIASKLSDKEQIISRTIDAACRMLSRSVERANNMEDREAIIRGEILPPVSKIIKLAAVTGVAYFIHPALAAITLLGKLMMSRKGRQKEKQLVIDELEVELKMIDKYIADAEERKNYKKEKELLLIKKKLQTQYERLEYKTKYESPDGDKYKFNSQRED